MAEKNRLPDKRFLAPRQDRTDAALTADELNSVPPLITLIRALQGGHSTNPLQRASAETTAVKLSGKTGLAKGVGRVLAEGPMQHDLGLSALRTLTPNASPMYRTNKVGETVTLGLGNFIKDQVQGALIGKIPGAANNPATKPIVKAALKQLENKGPLVNWLTDPVMYKGLYDIAGYLQKPRPELGGKSVYQSIPGFEEYLTGLASKDIANKDVVKNSKLLQVPGEHTKTIPFYDDTTLALLKLLAPDYAPPMEGDDEGRIMPKYDAYQYKPAMQGDYYTEELGLTPKQEQGWELIKLAKALQGHVEDFSRTRLAVAANEIGQDFSPLGILKVLKKHGKEAIFNTINPTPTFNPDRAPFNTRTSIPLQ